MKLSTEVFKEISQFSMFQFFVFRLRYLVTSNFVVHFVVQLVLQEANKIQKILKLAHECHS